MFRLPQIEPANSGQQHVSNNQIEQPPEDVDR